MTYLSQPTLTKTHLYFISEDDLWKVPIEGSKEAQRMTAGLGPLSAPCASPDGKWIAVASEEEGHCEVYLLPSEGGESVRLTYLGATSKPLGWLDSNTILIRSNYRHAHQCNEFFKVKITGGEPEAINLGEGVNMAVSPVGVVIERNQNRDPAHWKRYCGGRAGQFWCGKNFDSKFSKLSELKGNLSAPTWWGDRIYYLSDEDGLGRIYSCDADGKNKKSHAIGFKSEFYFRRLTSNGELMAFQSAGEVYYFNPKTDEVTKAEIKVISDVSKKKRKSVSPANGFQGYSLQPQGERVLIEARGKVIQMSHWSGAVTQLGSEYAVRYKCADWLNDGKRVALIADDGLEERLEVYSLTGECEKKVVLKDLKSGLGRVSKLLSSPKKDEIALSNHRNELIWVDLASGDSKLIFANKFQMMSHFSFSPCGRYIAFSESISQIHSRISIYDTEKKSLHPVTVPLLNDYAPHFDPEGKYLYFLSKRAFNLIYDDVTFDLGFAKGSLPFLVVLRKDITSPFIQESVLPDNMRASTEVKSKVDQKLEIDFDGIENRVIQFPVAEAKYTKIIGLGSKVLWSYGPVEGTNDTVVIPNTPSAKEYLDCFDFTTGKFEYFGTGLTEFEVRYQSNLRILRRGNTLQIIKATDKLDDANSKGEPSPKNGIIDLARAQIMLEPREEWIHMFKDSWRMQKEFFWKADLGGVNWDSVYQRYLPILDRINSRAEFSDLIWELIGELGTSHAYEMGGDYRPVPVYALGCLGARFAWNTKESAYEIKSILKGDRWNPNATSPLLSPGLNLSEGDFILEVAHQKLGESFTPMAATLGLAGKEVQIKIKRKGSDKAETCLIRLLKSDLALRYREWVEGCRKEVKKQSGGKLGYIHIPNMAGYGFAEFYRNFQQEVGTEGLIIDVRFNGGGHVSQLLLDRLSRVPLGKVETRWFGTENVPHESPQKVMVAIANEYAGSDGDIFSHTFKMKKLGKLIGTRTWGGVVGIWPRHRMIDGGQTTQPEFSYWFNDVGFNIENHGTTPDVVVEFPPEASRIGEDPQLDYAIKEAMKSIG